MDFRSHCAAGRVIVISLPKNKGVVLVKVINHYPAQIDTQRCVGCGVCVQICPRHVLVREDGQKVPAVRQDRACFNCAQCVAVCPRAAISLPDIRPEDLAPVQPALTVSEAQMTQFFKTRRSCRNYTDTPLRREEIEKLLDIAAYAPTGKNWRLVKWVVVSDPERVHAYAAECARILGRVGPVLFSGGQFVSPTANRMMRYDKQQCADIQQQCCEMAEEVAAGQDTILCGAPVLLFACADTRNLLAHDACITAMSHLELVAHGLGLGACWVGTFAMFAQGMPGFEKRLGLPAHTHIVSAMVVGHPKYHLKKIPKRSSEILWA